MRSKVLSTGTVGSSYFVAFNPTKLDDGREVLSDSHVNMTPTVALLK
jgi:hypothetical protein